AVAEHRLPERARHARADRVSPESAAGRPPGAGAGARGAGGLGGRAHVSSAARLGCSEDDGSAGEVAAAPLGVSRVSTERTPDEPVKGAPVARRWKSLVLL